MTPIWIHFVSPIIVVVLALIGGAIAWGKMKSFTDKKYITTAECDTCHNHTCKKLEELKTDFKECTKRVEHMREDISSRIDSNKEEVTKQFIKINSSLGAMEGVVSQFNTVVSRIVTKELVGKSNDSVNK